MYEPDLMGRLLGSCITGANRNNIAYTAEERKFITQGNRITVGFYEKTEPLAFVSPDGTYGGIYVELLRRIKEKTGLNIELYPISHSRRFLSPLSQKAYCFPNRNALL